MTTVTDSATRRQHVLLSRQLSLIGPVQVIRIANHPGFPAKEPVLYRACDPVDRWETRTAEWQVRFGPTPLNLPDPPDNVR